MIKKAIIPAAGLGTRFLPATKAQPKEMLPIVDTPAIQYIVEEAVASGIEDIIIVTGRNKRAIEDHFDRSVELEKNLEENGEISLLDTLHSISNLADIHYIRQKEPLGLGHAVYCARKFVGDEPFAVLLGDDIIQSKKPCLKQLIEIFMAEKRPIIGVQTVPWNVTGKYGIVKPGIQRGNITEVLDLLEKPKRNPPSNLAVMGRYILVPEILQHLAEIAPGAGGEIQLTDAIRIFATYSEVLAYEFEGKRYDIGDKMGFLQATIEFALMRDDLNQEFIYYLSSLLMKKDNFSGES